MCSLYILLCFKIHSHSDKIAQWVEMIASHNSYIHKIIIVYQFLFYTSEHLGCMYIFVLHVCPLSEENKRTSIPTDTEVTGGCDPPFGCWELDFGPMKVLLNTELSI